MNVVMNLFFVTNLNV